MDSNSLGFESFRFGILNCPSLVGGERDRPEGSRRVERPSHLVDGNNKKCLPNGRKGMQSLAEIEDVKKKIHARARKML